MQIEQKSTFTTEHSYPDFKPSNFSRTATQLFHKLNGETLYLSYLAPIHSVVHRSKEIRCVMPAIQHNEVYLHANKVILKNPASYSNEELVHFIATQAPLKESCMIYWKVLMNNSDVVIDLSQPKERNFVYYPSNNSTYKIGNLSINHLATIKLKNFMFYHAYKLKEGNNRSRLIYRIEYRKFEYLKDLQVDILERIIEVLDFIRPWSNLPVMVHGREGVGRTGVFMVASALKHVFNSGFLNSENQEDVISDLILQARRQRGPYTVQTSGHVKVLLEFAERLIYKQSSTSDLNNWLPLNIQYAIEPVFVDTRSHDDLYNKKRRLNDFNNRGKGSDNFPGWYSDVNLSVSEFQEMQFEQNKYYADEGSVNAQFYISKCLFDGEGTPVDEIEGVKYWNMANNNEFKLTIESQDESTIHEKNVDQFL